MVTFKDYEVGRYPLCSEAGINLPAPTDFVGWRAMGLEFPERKFNGWLKAIFCGGDSPERIIQVYPDSNRLGRMLPEDFLYDRVTGVAENLVVLYPGGHGPTDFILASPINVVGSIQITEPNAEWEDAVQSYEKGDYEVVSPSQNPRALPPPVEVENIRCWCCGKPAIRTYRWPYCFKWEKETVVPVLVTTPVPQCSCGFCVECAEEGLNYCDCVSRCFGCQRRVPSGTFCGCGNSS